jgi:hypothetical protein
MLSSAVVGIGAGIGALFLCAACFVVFQIYKRKREHNREIAEIEQGFPHVSSTIYADTRVMWRMGHACIYRNDTSTTAFRAGQQSSSSSFHLPRRADTDNMELSWTKTKDRTHAFQC